jgi:ribosomal protein S18 acetylase RimI-like enzyme
VVGISRLNRSEMSRAILTLARAFTNDPMFTWIFPDPRERSRSLLRMNRVPLQYGVRHGRVTAVNGAMAVAIWIPPGHAVTAGGMIRSGMISMLFGVGWRPFTRFVGANVAMGRFQREHVPEPHWYLLILGVDPEMQGRGLGSALVKEGLDRADETHRPCYLETSEERNVGFYERHGFVVVGTAPLGKGGPPGWAMRRDPRC